MLINNGSSDAVAVFFTQQIGAAMLAAGAAGVGVNLFTLALHHRRYHGTRPGEPVCPACRYVVKGITSNACPECGADLSAGPLLYSPPPPFLAWPAMLLAYGLLYALVVPPVFQWVMDKAPPLVWKTETVEYNGDVNRGLTSTEFVVRLERQSDYSGVVLIRLSRVPWLQDGTSPNLLLLPITNRCRLLALPREPAGIREYEEFARQAVRGDPPQWSHADMTRPFGDDVLYEFVQTVAPDEPDDTRSKIAADLSRWIANARIGNDLRKLNLVYLARLGVGESQRFHSTPRNLAFYTLTMLGLFALWPITILLLRTAAARKLFRRATPAIEPATKTTD